MPFLVVPAGQAPPAHPQFVLPFPHAVNQALIRLGLVTPTLHALLSVSCSFAGYRAMKRGIGMDHASPDCLTPTQIRIAHVQFLDAYCAAANDCGLPTIAFSTAVSEL